jgi:hypothetical protein
VSNTYGVRAAFGTVLWIVCGVGLVAALAALVLSSKAWEDYGKNGLLMDRESSSAPKPGSAAAMLERDEEIRQLLEARNARRQRRGEPPLDVEAELAALTAPVAADADLRAEIRDLVIARNYRRTRSGKPPLDVETEVDRQVAKLMKTLRVGS